MEEWKLDSIFSREPWKWNVPVHLPVIRTASVEHVVGVTFPFRVFTEGMRIKVLTGSRHSCIQPHVPVEQRRITHPRFADPFDALLRSIEPRDCIACELVHC